MKLIKRYTGEDARFYEVRDGVFYKSSTTVLSVRPTSKHLIDWFKDHTREQSERLLRDAALQGSKIHHTIDLILRGDSVTPEGMTESQLKFLELSEFELVEYCKKPYSEKEDRMMRGFLNWYKDYNAKTISSELTVYSDKYKYAGTLDWIGEIDVKQDGTKKKMTKKDAELKTRRDVVIVDWKTGKSLYPDYDLQLSSYFEAFKEMFKKDKKVKKPKSAWLLQLGVNKCGYKFQKVDKLKTAFDKFKVANKIWEEENPEAKPDNIYEYLDVYTIKN